jgi:hypothetical protein
MDAIRGHPWRQLVLATLLMALSLTIGAVLVPDEDDPQQIAAIAGTVDR